MYLFAFGLALAALLVAQPAQAVVWNSRPGPITPYDPPGEDALWEALDDYVNPVEVNLPWVLNHQTNQATFLIAKAGFDGEQMATLLLEIAGHKEKNYFGIYDPLAPETKVEIFAGDDSPLPDPVRKTVTFTKTVGGYQVSVDGIYKTGFISTELGFYLEYRPTRGTGWTFYTEDSRNEGKPQSLILVGDSSGETFIDLDRDGRWDKADPVEPAYEFRDVIVAFEDLPWDGEGIKCDEDYQDMVVFIDFQSPGSGAIPEPTSLAIWGVVGLGAAGLASLRRRRKLARWSDQDRQAIVQLIQAGRQR